MVGRGKGIVGTPGGSGGCTGAGAGATGALGAVSTAGPPSKAGVAGSVFDGLDALAGARTGAAGFRATAVAFFTGAATSRGRAALADGFPLAFGLVARPFCFPRPLTLRSARLPARCCRSISLTQV